MVITFTIAILSVVFLPAGARAQSHLQQTGKEAGKPFKTAGKLPVKPPVKPRFFHLKKAMPKKGAKTPAGPEMKKAVCSPAVVSTVPLFQGEWLSFSAEVKGIYAGRLVIEVKDAPAGQGKGKATVLARGGTNTFFSKIQKVKGSLESRIGTPDMSSQGFLRQMEFNEVRIEEDVKINLKESTLDADYEKAGVKQKRQFKLQGAFQDPISLLYYLRSIDLKKGNGICVDLYGLNVFWKVSGTVVGEEGVWVKAGYFKAIKLSGEARMLGWPNKVYKVSLWVSADGQRLPLKIAGVTEFGEVNIELEKYWTGKRVAKAREE